MNDLEVYFSACAGFAFQRCIANGTNTVRYTVFKTLRAYECRRKVTSSNPEMPRCRAQDPLVLVGRGIRLAGGGTVSLEDLVALNVLLSVSEVAHEAEEDGVLPLVAVLVLDAVEKSLSSLGNLGAALGITNLVLVLGGGRVQVAKLRMLQVGELAGRSVHSDVVGVRVLHKLLVLLLVLFSDLQLLSQLLHDGINILHGSSIAGRVAVGGHPARHLLFKLRLLSRTIDSSFSGIQKATVGRTEARGEATMLVRERGVEVTLSSLLMMSLMKRLLLLLHTRLRTTAREASKVSGPVAHVRGLRILMGKHLARMRSGTTNRITRLKSSCVGRKTASSIARLARHHHVTIHESIKVVLGRLSSRGRDRAERLFLSSQRTEKFQSVRSRFFTYIVLAWAMLVDEAILVKTAISLLLINEALEGARATARRVGHDDDYLF